MKYLLTLLSLLCINFMSAQKLGYELRTNGKSYFTISHKLHDKGGLELRHKTNLGENRFTYRQNFSFKNTPLTFSVPLHYKVEQHEPTLEPRLIYKLDKCKIWVQQEFWDELYNLAVATDITYKNYIYRLGWDTSNTIRFRISIKI